MITGIIFGLISGVILSWFSVDKICIEVLPLKIEDINPKTPKIK